MIGFFVSSGIVIFILNVSILLFGFLIVKMLGLLNK